MKFYEKRLEQSTPKWNKQIYGIKTLKIFEVIF